MSKLISIFLLLSSVGFAQSFSDGSFSVYHLHKVGFSLTPAQIHEAESIYHDACSVVQREFPKGAMQPCPRFTVLVGAERNRLHSRRTQGGQIWMKKWDPIVFAQGVIVLTFDQILTRDEIMELGNRAVQQSKAAMDVARLK